MKGFLLIAAMYSDEEVYTEVKGRLLKYGSFKEGKAYDFTRFTNYYEAEMGKGLLKRFLLFELEIEKNDLVRIKKETTKIELDFSEDGKRKINLDPGFLSKVELVLASFKKGTNYKEDLGEGVYAHKVLGFENKKPVLFWHTFPDYRLKENQEFFIKNGPRRI